GVDVLGSSIWRQQFPREAIDVPDKLEFLSRADSVILPSALAKRERLVLGDAFDVLTPTGRQGLRVRGMLAPVSAARLFDDALALMDLPAAQQLLGREGHVDRVEVRLAAGADIPAVEDAIAAALGPAVEV